MLDAGDIEFAREMAADLAEYAEDSRSETPGRSAKAMVTLIAELEQLRARVAELEAAGERIIEEAMRFPIVGKPGTLGETIDLRMRGIATG